MSTKVFCVAKGLTTTANIAVMFLLVRSALFPEGRISRRRHKARVKAQTVKWTPIHGTSRMWCIEGLWESGDRMHEMNQWILKKPWMRWCEEQLQEPLAAVAGWIGHSLKRRKS